MKNFIKIFFKIFFTITFEIFCALFIILLAFDLAFNDNLFQNFKVQPLVKIYDDSSNLIATVGERYIPTEISLAPKYLINALISIEDRTFFEHQGISYKSLLISIITNIANQKILRGGSTITQQLAKNIMHNHLKKEAFEKSLKRKIKEAWLTKKLESKYSKMQILNMYLNRIYFGRACYGIESAANCYFNKKSTDINIYEAALLIALIQAPSKYVCNETEWKNRAIIILKKMIQEKYLNKNDIDLNQIYEIQILKPELNLNNENYFVDHVIKNIDQALLIQNLIVHTTLNLNLQKHANDSIKYTLKMYKKSWKADQGAMIIIDENSEIKAMIGGFDYYTSNFNRTTQSKRPIASLAKYFVYLAAIESGIDINALIDTSPFELNNWKPSNFLYKGKGLTTFKNAFAKSINSPAIRLLQALGIQKILSILQRLQINEKDIPIPKDLTFALGSLNASLYTITKAFTPIMNDGYYKEPFCIKKIISEKTREVLYENQIQFEKKFDSRSMYYMWQTLKTTIAAGGSARFIKSGNRIFGGKTGTSNGNRDLYLVILNKNYCIGCWFGRDDYQPLVRISNETLSVIAMNKFLEKLKCSNDDIEFDIKLEDVNIDSFEDIKGKS